MQKQLNTEIKSMQQLILTGLAQLISGKLGAWIPKRRAATVRGSLFPAMR